MSGLNEVEAERSKAAELLRTMFVDIEAARLQAEKCLAHTDDRLVQSYAHQTIGIARREAGDLPGALEDLHIAIAIAERAGDLGRRADVQATLGGTLATAGRVSEGITYLNDAIAVLTGGDRATALVRRGWVYITLQGRFAEGAADMREAVAQFAAGGDDVWHARALNLLGYASLYLGDLDAADRHFEQAGDLYRHLRNDGDRAVTIQNRGYVAYLRGDFPATFTLLDEAASVLELHGNRLPDLVIDRTTAYLAAGLLPEAAEIIDTALANHVWAGREHAELLNAQAQVALAAGRLRDAEEAASRAVEIFEDQNRHWFATRAQLVALSARLALAGEVSDGPGRALSQDALALVEKSRRLHTPELIQVLLLAARITHVEAPEVADELLSEAETYRSHDAPLTRALGWLASARRHTNAGRVIEALESCERGLSAIDEHQALLGSTELRALATERGEDLAALAIKLAMTQQAGRAEVVLHWTERWRATAFTNPTLAAPVVGQLVAGAAPSANDAGAIGDAGAELARDLAALRAQTQQVNAARDAGKPSVELDQSIAALERRIRSRHMTRVGPGGGSRGHGQGARAPVHPDSTSAAGRGAVAVGDTTRDGATSARDDTQRLLEALDDQNATLVELFHLDGGLHAVTARRKNVELTYIGSMEEALRAQEFARFVLARISRGHRANLDQAAARLSRALLGNLDLPGDGPVIVSAPNRLHGVPWTLLPQLFGRPVSASPSARAWLRAEMQQPRSDRRAFVVGPGLTSGGGEVAALRVHDPKATYLTAKDATVVSALEAMSGAALVHIAAHGTFRSDNPLFSSIDLADGPLMVHDLEQLTAPPHRVVLSACETGTMKPVGADELLGLSASFLALGTAGVISSLVTVHDEATAAVMPVVHAALRSGESSATALLHARREAGADELLRATVVSFTSCGS